MKKCHKKEFHKLIKYAIDHRMKIRYGYHYKIHQALSIRACVPRRWFHSDLISGSPHRDIFSIRSIFQNYSQQAVINWICISTPHCIFHQWYGWRVAGHSGREYVIPSPLDCVSSKRNWSRRRETDQFSLWIYWHGQNR